MLCGIGSKTEETIIPAAGTPKSAVEFTASPAAENPVETEEEALAAEATPAAPEDESPAEIAKSPEAVTSATARADQPEAQPETSAPAEVILEPEEAQAEEPMAEEAQAAEEEENPAAAADDDPSEPPADVTPEGEAAPPADEAPAEEPMAENTPELEETPVDVADRKPVGAPIKWSEPAEKEEEMLPVEAEEKPVGAPIKWSAPADKEEEPVAEEPEEKQQTPSRRKFVPPPLSKMTLAQQQSMKDILAIPENLKRRIGFKPLKDGEKIGFSIEPRSTAVKRVIDNTQAYWKGVKPGWNVLSVNEVPIDVNTVKPSIKGAIAEKQEFCILFEMDKPFKPKVGKMASAARRR